MVVIAVGKGAPGASGGQSTIEMVKRQVPAAAEAAATAILALLSRRSDVWPQ